METMRAQAVADGQAPLPSVEVLSKLRSYRRIAPTTHSCWSIHSFLEVFSSSSALHWELNAQKQSSAVLHDHADLMLKNKVQLFSWSPRRTKEEDCSSRGGVGKNCKPVWWAPEARTGEPSHASEIWSHHHIWYSLSALILCVLIWWAYLVVSSWFGCL